MTIIRTVSFTASRDLDEAARKGVVTSILTVHVPHADRYVTGACVGGDAFIGRWLYANRPGAEHVVIVPANRIRVDEWWLEARGPEVTVIEMPAGTTYADRNAKLVAEAAAVFAFPAYPEDDPRSLRSGTWQTVRLARKSHRLALWQCLEPPCKYDIESPTLLLLWLIWRPSQQVLKFASIAAGSIAPRKEGAVSAGIKTASALNAGGTSPVRLCGAMHADARSGRALSAERPSGGCIRNVVLVERERICVASAAGSFPAPTSLVPAAAPLHVHARNVGDPSRGVSRCVADVLPGCARA